MLDMESATAPASPHATDPLEFGNGSQKNAALRADYDKSPDPFLHPGSSASIEKNADFFNITLIATGLLLCSCKVLESLLWETFRVRGIDESKLIVKMWVSQTI